MRRRRASHPAAGAAPQPPLPPNAEHQGDKRRRTLLAFGFSSRSSSSLHISSSASGSSLLPPAPAPPPPLPQWGRLIDESAVKIARLRRFLLLTGPAPPPGLPASRRHFTIPYSTPFNDAFNRTPGQGTAGSYGAWGSGVRSALNRGCLGVGGDEAGAGVGEAMLLVQPGDEEEDEAQAEGELDVSRGESGASDGGGAGAAGRNSHHRRNFLLIANWALERSGGLIDDPGDVTTLRALLDELSPAALELFLRAYHSLKPIYRLNKRPQEEGQDGPDVDAAVEELLGKGLVLDVPAMGAQGEGVVLMHTYDVLGILRADELARLNDTLLGPVGARGSSNNGGSSSGGGGGGGWSRTREDSLARLEGFISECTASPHPQQHALLRRRLGKDLLKFLGTCTAGSGSSRGQSRFLLVAPAVGKLLHRVYALFFASSGFEAEDAVVLLRNDLGALRFVDMTTGPQEPQQQSPEQEKPSATATAAIAIPALPVTRITPPFRPLFRHLLALLDTFEMAVQSGDGPVAYACLHQAADFFLPPPESMVAGEGEERGEARWESVIEVVDDGEEDDEDDDDVIVLEPDPQPPTTASGGAARAKGGGSPSMLLVAASSSSSLSAPVALPHRSSPSFPPGYAGLRDLPKPLLKMAVKILGRGINLLERERKHAEALHYLNIILDGTSSSSNPAPCLAAYRGHFHTRRVLDLGHLNRPEAQLKACEAALADADVDGEDRLFLQQKLVALAVPPRRWKKPTFPPLRAAPVLKLRLGDLGRRNGGGKSLEDRVLDYLLGEAMAEGGGRWEGAHCENAACLTVFGLLCHDVIFAPLDDDSAATAPFLTPYQNAPHDLTLGRGVFLARPARRAALNRCLARIDRGEARQMLAEAFADPRRRGAMCIGVDWRFFSLSSLQRIADGFGPRALRVLCEALAGDFSLWSHGLPDLMLWRADDDGGIAETRLVEVKGPGDNLSHAQMCWIDKLLAAGVRVEVARVAEAGTE